MSGQASRREEQLPQGTFLPLIDYNMAIWLAYQNCIQVELFGRHSQSFYNCVMILFKMILPEWMDAKFNEEAKGTPIEYFGAITNLLHRRKFFESRDNVAHL